jgi:hypothetical protein
MVALRKSNVRVHIISEGFRMLRHHWDTPTVIDARGSIRKNALTVIIERVIALVEVHIECMRNLTESHRFD